MSPAKQQSKKAVVVVLAGILASVLAGGFFYANAEEGYHGVKSYGQREGQKDGTAARHLESRAQLVSGIYHA